MSPKAQIPTNITCGISGWGSFVYQGPTNRHLKVASVTIFDITRCNRVYGNLPDKVICAGAYGGGEDSCQGDSGGGLFCNKTLVGVISFGLECGNDLFPGVYTDIRNFRDWLRNAEISKGLRATAKLSAIFPAVLLKFVR